MFKAAAGTSPHAIQNFGEGLGLAAKEIAAVNKEMRAAEAARSKAERAEIAADRAQELGKYEYADKQRNEARKYNQENQANETVSSKQTVLRSGKHMHLPRQAIHLVLLSSISSFLYGTTCGGMADSTDTYFLHLKDATTSGFRARLFAHDVSGKLRFGISTAGSAGTYGAADFNYNTTYQVVVKYNVSRKDMDEFSFHSHRKAAEAQDKGYFKGEIVPLEVSTVTPEGKRSLVFEADELIRRDTTLEGLAALRPAFKPDGQVTAGNSSPLSDGAAAVVVMSDKKAKELGCKPLMRFVGYAVAISEHRKL
jgi:hypothetical protein